MCDIKKYCDLCNYFVTTEGVKTGCQNDSENGIPYVYRYCQNEEMHKKYYRLDPYKINTNYKCKYYMFDSKKLNDLIYKNRSGYYDYLRG